MPLHRPIKRDQRRLFTNVKATPRITAPQRSQPPARRILVTGMSAILIVAVLAFGGNDYWSVTILEAGSVILLLFWLLPQLSSGKIQLRSGLLYLPMILFGSIIVAQVVLGLSAYAYVTRFELWKYAAYGGLFLLANQCGRTEAHRLLTILATFGFVVALCALLQYLTGRGEIYWKWPGLSSSFGPYFDHNHYAGLMEMLTPIPLVIALMEGSRRHAQLLWMVPAILMAATIFVCGSR